MGGGQNLMKISSTLHLKKIYQIRPLLAWSISLDNTFKYWFDSEVLTFTKSYWNKEFGLEWRTYEPTNTCTCGVNPDVSYNIHVDYTQ